MRPRSLISRIGVEGALLVLSPLPFLFPVAEAGFLDQQWQLVAASIATISCLVCAFTLFRKPVAGKSFGAIASVGCYVSAWPRVLNDPFIALTLTVLLISAIFALADSRIHFRRNRKNDRVSRCGQRAWWGNLMIPLVTLVDLLTGTQKTFFSPYVLAAS